MKTIFSTKNNKYFEAINVNKLKKAPEKEQERIVVVEPWPEL